MASSNKNTNVEVGSGSSFPAQANLGLNPDCSCAFCDHPIDSEYHDDPVLTYCGHIFGRACLETWAKSKRECPWPACGKPQFHARCGHQCLPRDPSAENPHLSFHIADRMLEPTCLGCRTDDVALNNARAQDPVLREKLTENRALAAWRLREVRHVSAAPPIIREFEDGLAREMAESARRWQAIRGKRTYRW